MTAATVITSILEYSDTTITSLSTIQNLNASLDIWTSIPTSLVSGSVYHSTRLANYSATTLGWGNQVVLYPTPFVEISRIMYAPGVNVIESGTSICEALPLTPPNPASHWSNLPTPYVFVPTPSTVWVGPGNVVVPTGILDAWIAQEPSITEKYPDLPNCSPLSGTGEPTIHIPVNGLTDHSTTTIKIDGGGGGDQPSPTPEPTPTSTPEPVVTPEPTPSSRESTPSSEPSLGPGPSGDSPQSTGGGASPSPESSLGDTNPPPASSNGQNPPPAGTSGSAPQPSGGNPPSITTGGSIPPQVSNSPTLPRPSLPVVVVPAPSGTGIVLPDDATLTPGQTTTFSGIEIFVPTAQPTGTLSVIVVDGTTQSLATEAPIPIYVPTAPPPSGSGAEATGTSTGTPEEHIGAARTQKVESWVFLAAAGIVALL